MIPKPLPHGSPNRYAPGPSTLEAVAAAAVELLTRARETPSGLGDKRQPSAAAAIAETIKTSAMPSAVAGACSPRTFHQPSATSVVAAAEAPATDIMITKAFRIILCLRPLGLPATVLLIPWFTRDQNDALRRPEGEMHHSRLPC
jgi:hypothetical protein